MEVKEKPKEEIDKNVQFNSINLSENQQVYESDLIQ